MYPNLVDLCQI